ncbi:MAG: spore maturation protein [Clostridia bacterium]
MIKNLASYTIPIFIVIILMFAFIKKTDIWSAFTEGGKKGLRCAIDILPPITGLVVAIEILSASGALEAFSSFFSPLCNILNIPREILPLSLMRCVSGSGSMALFQNILGTHSPDSYIGRCASVIMGSTETTFYTLSIYFAATRAKKLRYCLVCALLADLTGSIVGCFICRFI